MKVFFFSRASSFGPTENKAGWKPLTFLTTQLKKGGSSLLNSCNSCIVFSCYLVQGICVACRGSQPAILPPFSPGRCSPCGNSMELILTSWFPASWTIPLALLKPGVLPHLPDKQVLLNYHITVLGCHVCASGCIVNFTCYKTACY